MRENDGSIVYVMFVVVYNFNRKTLLPVIPRESGGLFFHFQVVRREKKESKKVLIFDEIFM